MLLSLSDLGLSLLLGTGIGIGYFVVLLSTLILLHPLVVCFSRSTSLIIGAVLTALALALAYWVRIALHEFWFAQFPYTVLPFPVWLVFYCLGFYMAEPVEGTISRAKLRVLIALLLALSFVESALLSVRLSMVSLAVSQVKLTSFLCSASIVVVALSPTTTWLSSARLLAWMGRRSYAFYLCHMLFLDVAGRLLRTIQPAVSNQILYVPLAILFTASMAAVSIACAERILPRAIVPFVLGMRKEAHACVTA